MKKNSGKKFEDLLKLSCEEQGIDYTRFRDAGWQGEKTARRFTVSNICDCFLFDGKTLLFLELKHRKQSLRFDELKQLGDIEKKYKPDMNIHSGFLCSLKGRVFYIDTPSLRLMETKIDKKSFNAFDAEEWGREVNEYIPKGCRKPRLNIRGMFFEFQ